jgi:hypothetical protein
MYIHSTKLNIDHELNFGGFTHILKLSQWGEKRFVEFCRMDPVGRPRHMTLLGCDSCRKSFGSLPEVDVSGLEGGVAKAALA